jgi:hypothetical protein
MLAQLDGTVPLRVWAAASGHQLATNVLEDMYALVARRPMLPQASVATSVQKVITAQQELSTSKFVQMASSTLPKDKRLVWPVLWANIATSITIMRQHQMTLGPPVDSTDSVHLEHMIDHRARMVTMIALEFAEIAQLENIV